MSDYPTIALIGPGAIGTTIAAVLHDAGRKPLLCGRTAHPELRLRHDEGETVVPGPVLTDPAAITRPVDLVFIAVKTTQNADSAGWLRALCDENTVVCALQNGVEQKAQLEPLVSGATVLPSVVWFPAQREPDASVWLRAKPRLTLPDVPQAQRVAEALRGTRCEVELSADFPTVAWRKLLQNAVAGLMVLANPPPGCSGARISASLRWPTCARGLLSPAPRGRSWPMTWRRRFWRTFSARLRTSARRFSLTVRRIARWSGTSATA